jgi:hypothetical protein
VWPTLWTPAVVPLEPGEAPFLREEPPEAVPSARVVVRNGGVATTVVVDVVEFRVVVVVVAVVATAVVVLADWVAVAEDVVAGELGVSQIATPP